MISIGPENYLGKLAFQRPKVSLSDNGGGWALMREGVRGRVREIEREIEIE